MSHAFLADMGGIALQLQNDDPFPITAKQLAWLVEHGHTVTKALAVLRTAWFMIQLIGRLTEHLPITPIELASAALALTPFTTLRFWREKPLDVRYSYLIKLGHIPSVNVSGTRTAQTELEEMESQESVTLTHAVVLPLEEIEPRAYISRKWSGTALSYLFRLGLQKPRMDRIPNDRDPQVLGFRQLLRLRLFISWISTLLLRPKQSFSFGVQTAASCGLFSRHMVQQKCSYATRKDIRGWEWILAGHTNCGGRRTCGFIYQRGYTLQQGPC